MPYVVTGSCINCRYGECIEVCPQNAFREGTNFLVIDPFACSNCALCEMICPAGAIYPDYGLTDDLKQFIEVNKSYAQVWPPATYKGALKDADSWAREPNKIQLIKS